MREPSPIRVGCVGTNELCLLTRMANRHGLIAGATGTGKTITLQVLAEAFSAQGVPVFLADAKGDLSGIAHAGTGTPRIADRIRELRLGEFSFEASPVTFWDVYGDQGHPIRATVSEMGPLLLARLLQLNEIQSGVLTIAFRVADDEGLLLLDLKDLRALLAHLAEHAAEYGPKYGNISSASIGAIQRGLTSLEQQGAERFFAEPALNLDDLLQTDASGRGIVNILAADRLLLSPRVYATLLLWLLSELFEQLPEVGDLPKPKLVFFFDEAHLLFADTPPVVLEKIEQVVRLIRSKGVGVYFVTQNPADLPDAILGQLGNRIQHALRAFTPKDQKAVRAAADTFRANPSLDTREVLTQLEVGEALVSLLDERGQPGMVERVRIVPPRSRIGPITPQERRALMDQSLVAGVYEKQVDRESAYERLTRAHATPPSGAPSGGGFFSGLFGGTTAIPNPSPTPGSRSTPASRGRAPESLVQAMAKSAVRTVGSSIGRELVRGIMGSLFGGRRR